jgi:hypothetical protein
MLPLSLRSTYVSLVDPTVPPVLSLPGAVRLWIVGRTAFDSSFQVPPCLHKATFSLTGPRECYGS